MGGFAPKGHARLNPASPAAFAICDRCGFMYNHRDLRSQMEYRGKYLQKTGHLVCDTCYDVPNPTLRPIVLPADPPPILNPRAEPMHCHVFKPRADIEPPFHSPDTRYGRADIKWDNYPPVDHFKDVTVDSGDTCDTRFYKDGWSVPVPPFVPPIPPLPPIKPPDATSDNTRATADATGTTVDASPVMPPVLIVDNTADTTKVDADATKNSVNTFPDYESGVDETAETADITVPPTADDQT